MYNISNDRKSIKNITLFSYCTTTAARCRGLRRQPILLPTLLSKCTRNYTLTHINNRLNCACTLLVGRQSRTKIGWTGNDMMARGGEPNRNCLGPSTLPRPNLYTANMRHARYLLGKISTIWI